MQKILNKLTDKKYRRYLAAVLCVLVLALLFIPDNKEKKTETEEQKPKLTEAYSYVAETEERLEKLISDGRIHPARIEEMYEKARREVEAMIKSEGERAIIEAGVNGLHPELVKLLGRLH